MPIVHLVEHLINSKTFTFSHVLAIKPKIDFLAGISSPSSDFNLLTLKFLHKAAESKSDCDIVAGRHDLVGALIRLWLCTTHTTVAQEAHQVIYDLLRASQPIHPQFVSPFNSLIWRRIFEDRDIYGSIFAICSLSTIGQNGQPSRGNKTVAQARLLGLLGQLECKELWKSRLPDVEAKYGVKDGGLYEFAAVYMVDYKGDVLMHITLIDFFTSLLRNNLSNTAQSAPTLDFLLKHGLHARTISYYLEPEKHSSLDVSYLYAHAANYVSVYASSLWGHLLSSSSVLKSIILRLSKVLDGVSRIQWAQGQTPKDDLHVLASLPRVALLPRQNVISPLLLIPPHPANRDAYNTLAGVFAGKCSFPIQPKHQSNLNGQSDTTATVLTETSAARALYYFYIKKYPDFWYKVVHAGKVGALEEVAIAATGLVTAVICAEWDSLPADELKGPQGSPFSLLSEKELERQCNSPEVNLSTMGLLAGLAKPAGEEVVDFLTNINPASHSDHNNAGAPRSTSYKVATTKHDMLVFLHQQLLKMAPKLLGQPMYERIIMFLIPSLARQVERGPLGQDASLGSSIGTLEL